jgi:hypothetical protein
VKTRREKRRVRYKETPRGPANPKQPKTIEEEEEAVTPCTRDYVATNGWLSKGRNRLTSGTARNPCFKRLTKNNWNGNKHNQPVIARHNNTASKDVSGTGG